MKKNILDITFLQLRHFRKLRMKYAVIIVDYNTLFSLSLAYERKRVYFFKVYMIQLYILSYSE